MKKNLAVEFALGEIEGFILGKGPNATQSPSS